MRGKFEGLEEIADKLEHLFFEDGFYFRKYDDADSDEYFVNGAWYAYQEQQKKIDKIVSLVWDETDGHSLDNKIQEILK